MKKKKMREAGILLPVSSLPSEYGIGCFSKEAYEFVDSLEKAGQKYWQVLPLGPTGYGDSPYQSFSTYAGNPYFIDLEELIEKGWLSKKACDEADFGSNPSYVDYEKIYNCRFDLLRNAFINSDIQKDRGFKAFVKENKAWLEDYALYMAIKVSKDNLPWNEWEEDIKLRKPAAVKRYKKELSNELEFYQFQQYMFHEQWNRLKSYANAKGIKIIGDIPIYVAFDSADAWANPELFKFDVNSTPTGVAGCPPDCFSVTGQLWGNPLYDWEYHRSTGYEWWMRRLAHVFSICDVVRIDHFRGFDAYYNIPYGDPTAEFGHWEEGPGYELFETMVRTLGEREVIAEDLGFLTSSVRKMVKKTGYPGMKIIQFAFDPSGDSEYLPYRYPENCVVYTGTHDNDTSAGWFKSTDKASLAFAKKFIGVTGRITGEKFADALVRQALASPALLAVIPVQDYLGLGSEARINTPSTLGDNWKWRMTKGQLTDEKCRYIAELTAVYGRNK